MEGLKPLFAGISVVIILSLGAFGFEAYKAGQYKREIGNLEGQIEMLEGKVEGLKLENEQLIKAPKETNVVIENAPEFELSDEDIELIARIVHAEAGNQDQIGKRLVADCILNRVKSDKFPDTVQGVIYQAGQFTATPGDFDESDINAVTAECEQRIDPSVYWFKINGFHSVGVPLYQHGAHYFNGLSEGVE